MNLWSTCNACGEAMRIYMMFPEAQSNHPTCPDTPDYVQQLDRRMQEVIRAEDFDRLDTIGEEIEKYFLRPLKHESAATLYAQWGWPVFPLQPGMKTPATPHGFHDATTDTKRIHTWWTRNPEYNIGIATGVMFDAIDVDTKTENGIKSWNEIETDTVGDVHGWNLTPSGGFHALTVPTGGGNLTGVYPGIDYRGKGGYIAVPPSTLIETEDQRAGRYRWSTKPSPVIKRK